MPRNQKPLPLRTTMCGTCPWQVNSPYAYLTTYLATSALTEASRICHCTGSNNGVHQHTGKPPALCRGARDVQLRYFAKIGFIAAPTDEAWASKWAEMQDGKKA